MLSGKEPLTLSAAKAKQTGLERMVWSKGAGQLRPCELRNVDAPVGSQGCSWPAPLPAYDAFLLYTLYHLLPVTQASLLNEPANETVIIHFLEFTRSLLFLLEPFAQCDEPTGLFYRETLIQEGVDKQVHIIFLHLYCPPYCTGYKTSVPRERSTHYYIFYSIAQTRNVLPV